MNTVLDKNTVETMEKEKHNAMISERYRRLLDAVDGQHSTERPTMERESYYAPSYTMDAPTYAPISETPVAEHIPDVTTYTPSAVAASVFTTEKLDRMFGHGTATEYAPVKPVEIIKPKMVTEVSYSLSSMAKVAMAAFASVVVIMLTLIGVNTATIQRKTIKLRNLEEKKQELMEKNDEIQRRIQELQTEESIIERATEAGLLS